MKKLISIFLLITLISCSNNQNKDLETQKNEQKQVEKEKQINKDDEKNDLYLSNLQNQADNFFKNKNYKDAIIGYEEILKTGKSNSKILNSLFVSYVYTVNYQKAINILTLTIKINGANENLVGSYIKENNLSDKIVKLQKQIEKDGQLDDKILVEYAVSLYEAGDYYYELDKQKYYLAIMLHYISSYLALEDAEKINKDNSLIYYYKGRLIMDIGSPMEFAEEELKKAIALKQDDFNYYYRLGNAYMHQDKYELAKETFLKGISLNDKYEKLHLNLGNMYFKLNERDKGYKSYDDGIKICSEICDGFYHNIGNELLNEGKTEEAKKAYNKALEYNPNKTEVIEALKKLNNN